MMRLWAVAIGLAHGAMLAPLGPAPRALVRLYDKTPHMSDAGEPTITVGLVQGQDAVTLWADGPAQATFVNDAGTHRVALPAHSRLHVVRRESQPAKLTHWVPLGDAVFATSPTAKVAPAPCGTPQPTATLQRTGSVWPMLGGTQDLRRQQWAVPCAHELEARALYQALVGCAPEVLPPARTIAVLPRGVLQIYREGTHHTEYVGEADSIVALDTEPHAAWTLDQVRVAIGYPQEAVVRRSYRGHMAITLGADGLLTVVNAVPLETLLQGVVPAEMPASAPPQALAAQAIAARSSIVYELGQRHLDAPFHVCAEQHCQVYAGKDAEDPRAQHALDETRGKLLTHGGRAARALYAAQCGGRTENNDVAWPQAPSPALQSVSDQRGGPEAEAEPVTWDQPGALAAFLRQPRASWCGSAHTAPLWHKELDKAALATLWAPYAAQHGALVAVVPGARGPGGRLLTLSLQGERGEHVLHREWPIRAALGGLKSAAFEVTPKTDARGHLVHLTLQGTGWGHGVGMCQRGAMARAAHGASAEAILTHYYPGSAVLHLW